MAAETLAPTAPTSVNDMPELKRLAFVQNLAVSSAAFVAERGTPYFHRACGLYSSLKDTKLKNGLESIESAMVQYTEPLILSAKEKAPVWKAVVRSSLAVADEKVDSKIMDATEVIYRRVESLKAHASVLNAPVTKVTEKFTVVKSNAAKVSGKVHKEMDEYFKRIELAVEAVKSYVPNIPEVKARASKVLNDISTARQNMTDSCGERCNEQVTDAYIFVTASFESLLKHPSVTTAVGKISPYTIVVKEKSAQLLNYVQENERYQAYVAPQLEKYVAPQLNKLKSSETYAIMLSRVDSFVKSVAHIDLSDLDEVHGAGEEIVAQVADTAESESEDMVES